MARFPEEACVFVQVGNFYEALDASAEALHRVLGYKYVTTEPKAAGFNTTTTESTIDRLCNAGGIVVCVRQVAKRAKRMERAAWPAETLATRTGRPIARVTKVERGWHLEWYDPSRNVGSAAPQRLDALDQVTLALLQGEACEVLVDTRALERRLRSSALCTDWVVRVTRLTLSAYLALLGRDQGSVLPSTPRRRPTLQTTLALDETTAKHLGLVERILEALDPRRSIGALGRAALLRRLRHPFRAPATIDAHLDRMDALRTPELAFWAQRLPKHEWALFDPRHRLWRFDGPATMTLTNLATWRNHRAQWTRSASEWGAWWDGVRGAVGGEALDASLFVADQPNPFPTFVLSEDGRAHFEHLRSTLSERVGTALTWCTVPKYEWMLEAATEVHDPTLVLVSKTKTAWRYDSPALRCARVDLEAERLRFASHEMHTLRQWIGRVVAAADTLRPTLEAMLRTAVELRLLHGRRGPTCRPHVRASLTGGVAASGLHNGEAGCVGVDLTLHAGVTTLRGHNGSGKTTLLKTLALNTLLAHCGLPVFATSFVCQPMDRIALRFGSNDDLRTGRCSLDDEIEHMVRIMARATPTSLVLLDELGCCCDAESGHVIGQRVWDRLNARGVTCVFATHFALERQPVLRFGPHFRLDRGPWFTEPEADAIACAQRCGLPATITARALARWRAAKPPQTNRAAPHGSAQTSQS